MNFRLVFFGFAALALSACDPEMNVATNSDPAEVVTEGIRITTAQQFDQYVVGKRLLLDGDYIIVAADGTMNGTWDGAPLPGTWEWRDGYFCRKLEIQDNKEDCQLWVIDGIHHTVTRNQGAGRSFTYVVN